MISGIAQTPPLVVHPVLRHFPSLSTHSSKANEFAQIVVPLSKDRDAKIARTAARRIRLVFMAAPFRLQLVGRTLTPKAKLDEWITPLR